MNRTPNAHDQAALGVVRLSRDDDASTSVERQHEAIEALAKAKGLQIIGWAEDVDVPGDVAPWDRPELGEWIPDPASLKGKTPDHKRLRDFSHVIVWKLDRLSRKTMHLLQTVEMLNHEGISIHSVDDGYDPSGQAGKMMLAILGTVAEGEHESMKVRAKSSRKKLREAGRFPGGTPPFGYSIEKADAGYRLVIDPEQARQVKDIYRRLLDGETVNSVITSLNDAHVPSPFDQQRIKAGKEPKGNLWRTSNLNRLIKSPTLLGYATVKNKNGTGYQIIRSEMTGQPIMRAEPIVTPEEQKAVIEELRGRIPGGRQRKNVIPSPLLGVVVCGCGLNMYRYRGRNPEYVYLRCASRQTLGKGCTVTRGKGIRESEVYEQLISMMRGLMADVEIVEKVYLPGSDHSAELRDVGESLSDLMDDRAAGLYRGAAQTEKFRNMVRALEDRREALEALESRPDGWDYRGTGETWGEWLDAHEGDKQAVGDMLRRVGAKAEMTWTPEGLAIKHLRVGKDTALPNVDTDGLTVGELWSRRLAVPAE